MAFTFHKTERLISTILISKLFEKGNRSIARFPFRFTWLPTPHPGEYAAQVLFVVPKRSFPSAVQRNKIKRQLRELYRLHKHHIYEACGDKQLVIAISYNAKTAQRFDTLNIAFQQIIKDFCGHIKKNN